MIGQWDLTSQTTFGGFLGCRKVKWNQTRPWIHWTSTDLFMVMYKLTANWNAFPKIAEGLQLITRAFITYYSHLFIARICCNRVGDNLTFLDTTANRIPKYRYWSHINSLIDSTFLIKFGNKMFCVFFFFSQNTCSSTLQYNSAEGSLYYVSVSQMYLDRIFLLTSWA